MHAVFRLKGFPLPHVQATTSIQQTFVSALTALARPGTVLRYAPHRFVKQHQKGLWRAFVGCTATMGGGLGLVGLHVLEIVPTVVAHVGLWIFALPILPLFAVVMGVGYSLNAMPEELTLSTRQRFLRLGAHVANKDHHSRPLLKEFGGQLEKGFPNQWWESVCVALEEYDTALNTRVQYEQKQMEEERLQEVFVAAVDTVNSSNRPSKHITV